MWRAAIVLLPAVAAIADPDPMAEARRAIEAKDHARAREILRPAVEAGSVDAGLLLGELLEKGLGGEADPRAAAALYSSAAEAGSAEGHFRLGLMRAEGRGVAQKATAAADEWRAAAEAGHIKAQYQLGAMLVDSPVFKHRQAEGGKWLLAAATAGSWDAQYKLIILYDEGRYFDGVERAMRAEWVTAGAKRGHADAQYRCGLDPFKSREEQISWLRKAAEQGHTAAMTVLGEHLKYQVIGKPRASHAVILEEARRWLLEAAKDGHAEAAQTLYRVLMDLKQPWGEWYPWMLVHVRMCRELKVGALAKRRSDEGFAKSMAMGHEKELARARERADEIWELVKDGVERRKR